MDAYSNYLRDDDDDLETSSDDINLDMSSDFLDDIDDNLDDETSICDDLTQSEESTDNDDAVIIACEDVKITCRDLKVEVQDLLQSLVEIPGKNYLMCKFQITQEQWAAVMGECERSSYIDGVRLPVDGVEFYECNEFIKKLNAIPEVVNSGLTFRLPTDKEWIHACRAGSKGKCGLLVDGTEGILDEMGWYKKNLPNSAGVHPVGQKKPNAWGLYDMHGNVKEWVDSRCRDLVRICLGGSESSSAEGCECGKSASLLFKILYSKFPKLDILKWIVNKCKFGFWYVPSHSSIFTSGIGFRLVADRLKKQKVNRDIIKELIGSMVQIPDRDYLICKYQVTQELWKTIMGENLSHFYGSNLPVENVSWDSCQKFIKRLNSLPDVKKAMISFRLPTEEEWEHACRAGSVGKYGSLDNSSEVELDEIGWYNDNSTNQTHPIGQKKPNAWGLYDMHGNVWEWTATEKCNYRVVRGGGYKNDIIYCEASFRISNHHHYIRREDIGLRLAASKVGNASDSLLQTKTLLETNQTDGRLCNDLLKNKDIIKSQQKLVALGIEMIRIPDSDDYQGLYFGRYPITQAQWERIMGENPSYFQGDENPVENVSWNDSQDFIKKLNAQPEILNAGIVFRLPTRKEWEYAARAGSKGYYGSVPNGREGILADMGWFKENSNGKTHPVGYKMPNAWGLYDMHGNVLEWAADDNFDVRFCLGGFWDSTAEHSEIGSGFSGSPDFRRSACGLRLVSSSIVKSTSREVYFEEQDIVLLNNQKKIRRQ